MIPKIIHYCWFGKNPKPELAQKCIESWREYCPDYSIVEWNEENFEINSNLYVKQAYEAKKWAFVTDYVRLYALYTFGGVYMDTDVRVLRNIDQYLRHDAFSGFESTTKIPTGIMASMKANPLIGELLHYYDEAKFFNQDGTYNMTTNVEIITNMLTSRGFIPNGKYQVVSGMAFYPQNVFCPDTSRLEDKEYTKDTATVHYFAASWKSETRKKRERTLVWKVLVWGYRIMIRIFGESRIKFVKKISRKVFRNE